MGMFDYVHIKCPHCGVLHEEQSKSGSCVLNHYSLNGAPMAVLADVLGRHTCEKCGKLFVVELVNKPLAVARAIEDWEDNDDDEYCTR